MNTITDKKYLAVTEILDYNHPALSRLVEERGWRTLGEAERIGAVYNYVRDEIPFGYNRSDDLPASEVLGDGYGQCNTKGTLLIALLRAGGVPARFHGFTIDNALQKGAIPGYIFPLAPKEIIHSWVEIEFQGLWVNLEGFILDKPYLQGVRSLFPESTGAFSGYAIATNSIEEPPIDWNGSDTYIQSEGIARDFGVFDDPDSFYELHGTNLSGLKRFLYRYLVRHLMNWNVRRIRRR